MCSCIGRHTIQTLAPHPNSLGSRSLHELSLSRVVGGGVGAHTCWPWQAQPHISMVISCPPLSMPITWGRADYKEVRCSPSQRFYRLCQAILCLCTMAYPEPLHSRLYQPSCVCVQWPTRSRSIHGSTSRQIRTNKRQSPRDLAR